MASKMLGRAACPECGFSHAHIKISDKENAKAYRYCPECGSQYYARSQAQHDKLTAKMCHPPALIDQAAPASAAQPPSAPSLEKAPDLSPPAPASYKVILGVKVPA